MIVNRKKVIARFAFMHCIMASLCFWMQAIFDETLDSITSKRYFYVKSECDKGYDSSLMEWATRSDNDLAGELMTGSKYLN